jgi:hypothetical protein
MEPEVVMTKLRCCGFLLLVLPSCFAFGQDNPGGWTTFHPNEEVRVPQLPALTAHSHDRSDVLLASLDVLFHDPSICCGKNSALEDRALAANPLSLTEIASKVQGRQLLSDGRRILITADFRPAGPSGDISSWIVGALRDRHALLMVWNSHLYVLYGATFDEIAYSDIGGQDMIHKLFLLDTRYSDSRREVTFNRDTDDWAKVEGVLLLTVASQ